tara:strand:- start:931 stop:1107 length:177 start_codon:yes stop_codon:yes gene_type:complete
LYYRTDDQHLDENLSLDNGLLVWNVHSEGVESAKIDLSSTIRSSIVLDDISVSFVEII